MRLLPVYHWALRFPKRRQVFSRILMENYKSINEIRWSSEIVLLNQLVNCWHSSQLHSMAPAFIVPHPRTANFKSQKVITDFRPLSFSHSIRDEGQLPISMQVCKSQSCHTQDIGFTERLRVILEEKKENLQIILMLLFVQTKWAVQHSQGTIRIPLCFPLPLLLSAVYRTLGVGCLSWTWTTVSQTVNHVLIE